MSAGLLFLIAQTVSGLPALPAGTEVRLVSPDLLTVYASARLENDTLTFVGAPSPGTELRVLIFPPDAGAAARAEALSGARAVPGRVNADGSDILLDLPDRFAPTSLRDLLKEQHGIVLELKAGKEG